MAAGGIRDGRGGVDQVRTAVAEATQVNRLARSPLARVAMAIAATSAAASVPVTRAASAAPGCLAAARRIVLG